MVSSGFLLIVTMVILSTSLSSSYMFNVGGRNGWGARRSPEHYNAWSGRTRFRINDTLRFKYNKGSDSVLLVNQQDYDSCDTKNPIYKMDDGESTFSLNKTGPFYFISGVNCQNGEKFKVLVLSPHHHQEHLAPVYSPAPSPSLNSPTYSPAPSSGWTAPSQSPSWNSPSPSPAQPPAWNSPSPSFVGWTAPTQSLSQSPNWNAPSPSEVAPVHSPTISPAANAPSPSATEKTDSAPPPTDKNDSPPSATNNDSPAPPPDQSDSTRLSGYVNVGVVVALVLGSFAF